MNFGLFGATIGQVFQIFGASDKIVKMMSYQAKINTQGGLEQENPVGKVNLDEVQFRYPSKPDVLILNGVTIEINN